MDPMATNINYRPEIDGLRALAVLGVLIYHLNPSWLPGGYLGVDIFFVISGFLITSILVKGWEKGDFSYKEFYLRRARRILPAMLVVTALTCFASYFILFPDEMKSAGRACRQAMLCCSNYFFAKGDGYFDPGAESNPFLHTWSLGVEEQFYFVFPIFGLLAFRRGWLKARWVGGFVLIGLIGASLLSHFTPTYAFFSLESRAWELALGSWLAVANARGSILTWLKTEVFGFLSLLLMIVSLIFLGRSGATPAPAALLPVIGAALFIAGRAGGECSLIHRVFTLPPMLYLGRISYVLYLVHWPVIVLVKARFGNLDAACLGGLALLSLLISVILHHGLEEPLRRGTALKATSVFLSFLAIAWLLLFVASQVAVSLKGQVNSQLLAEMTRVLPEYTDKKEGRTTPFRIGDLSKQATLGLWGDSHALALGKGLDLELKSRGLCCEVWAKGGHLPGNGIELNDDLLDMNDRALKALARPEIKTVFIAARWSVYLKGKSLNMRGRSVDDPHIKNSSNAQEAATLIEASLDRSIQQLKMAKGKEIVLSYPVPELNVHAPYHLIKLARNGDSIDEARFNYPLEFYIQRHDLTLPMLDRLVSKFDLLSLHPEKLFINKQGLQISAGGLALYCDDDHLSREGAVRLAQSFFDLKEEDKKARP